jgi:cobalt/nickel transport system permease protein
LLGIEALNRLLRCAILAWILLIAFTPITRLQWLALELILLAFLLGLTGLSLGRMMAKWQGALLTLIFLGVFVALGHPLRGRLGMWPIVEGIVLKNAVLLGTVTGLISRLGSIRLIEELRIMRLPDEIINTISLMSRYVPLLGDQLQRMRRARESRMIRRSLPGLWLVQTGGLSTLLVRSLERAERLHEAMLARGWQMAAHSDEKNGILADETAREQAAAKSMMPRNN